MGISETLFRQISFRTGFFRFTETRKRQKNFIRVSFCVDLCWFFVVSRRVTRGGGGGEYYPALFAKIGKSALIQGKNALVLIIYVLNFSFKMQFLSVSMRKNVRFYPEGPFFLVLYMIVCQSVLIPRKLPCPKKFLVTRMVFFGRLLPVRTFFCHRNQEATIISGL